MIIYFLLGIITAFQAIQIFLLLKFMGLGVRNIIPQRTQVDDSLPQVIPEGLRDGLMDLGLEMREAKRNAGKPDNGNTPPSDEPDITADQIAEIL
jgi:hypothetical protein